MHTDLSHNSAHGDLLRRTWREEGKNGLVETMTAWRFWDKKQDCRGNLKAKARLNDQGDCLEISSGSP